MNIMGGQSQPQSGWQNFVQASGSGPSSTMTPNNDRLQAGYQRTVSNASSTLATVAGGRSPNEISPAIPRIGVSPVGSINSSTSTSRLSPGSNGSGSDGSNNTELGKQRTVNVNSGGLNANMNRRQSSPAAVYQQSHSQVQLQSRAQGNMYNTRYEMGPPPMPTPHYPSPSVGSINPSNNFGMAPSPVGMPGTSTQNMQGFPPRPPMNPHAFSHPRAVPMVNHYRHNFYSDGFPASQSQSQNVTPMPGQSYLAPSADNSRRGSIAETGEVTGEDDEEGVEGGGSIYDPYTVSCISHFQC